MLVLHASSDRTDMNLQICVFPGSEICLQVKYHLPEGAPYSLAIFCNMAQCAVVILLQHCHLMFSYCWFAVIELLSFVMSVIIFH